MEKGGRPHFTKHEIQKLVDIVWFTCPSSSVLKIGNTEAGDREEQAQRRSGETEETGWTTILRRIVCSDTSSANPGRPPAAALRWDPSPCRSGSPLRPGRQPCQTQFRSSIPRPAGVLVSTMQNSSPSFKAFQPSSSDAVSAIIVPLGPPLRPGRQPCQSDLQSPAPTTVAQWCE